jgi:hypothetical protein
MTTNKNRNYKDMTLKSLEKKLRMLGKVDAPSGLEASLIAAIPKARSTRAKCRSGWWSGGVSLATAAAAVLILALVFIQNFEPAKPPQKLITEANDIFSRSVLADHNNIQVGDINLASVKMRR